METFDTHVNHLAALTSDIGAKPIFASIPMNSDENVRLLCRQAVALLYSNVN